MKLLIVSLNITKLHLQSLIVVSSSVYLLYIIFMEESMVLSITFFYFRYVRMNKQMDVV